ncbi:MAG: sporulation initiation factor Spo0A C-terminal domain-containing protein [Clostridiales bacterium]|nr:sporulation initiation factor Spo0A C-terminal domain-containing protein [Clostridiales bacterium]
MDNRKNQPDGIFKQIAAKYGVSVTEVVREIQVAIDAAWDNPDPAIRARQRELFPHGKPSVEEFIRVIAKQAEK